MTRDMAKVRTIAPQGAFIGTKERDSRKVMKMKISKSKRQLAQLLIEAGVTQFPEGASWAAQDKCNPMEGGVTGVTMYSSKPTKPKAGGKWWNHGGNVGNSIAFIKSSILLIPNWHQTVLSRDEFDQIVAEVAPDADGWIEWSSGECPVGEGDRIDVKFSDGDTLLNVDCDWDWGEGVDGCNIIAYRLHKPEQVEPQHCEPVTRSTTELASAPTIDQLLQDWRNADDFSKSKQAEADEAAAMRDERWDAVQARAGEMGVTVGLCESVAAEPEQVEPVKPVMTGKFRNAKIGSPKHYISNKGWSDEICDECGKCFGEHFDINCNSQ